MPLKLSTTVGKIQHIPNSKNIDIINEFLEYYLSSIYDAVKYVINNKNKTDKEEQEEGERLRIGEEIYRKQKERAVFYY